MNAEFPEERKFHLSLLPGNRYKVCGDPEEVQGSEPTPSSSGSMLHCPSSSMLPGPSTHSRGWSIPPPWMSAAGHSGHSANPPKGKNLQSRNYEPFLKQSFQFVTLSLDHTGKNITTQSTNENVYVKIPESSVLVPAILSEIALKVSIPSEDLVILDSKYMSQMIKVSMHAKFNIVILVNMYLYHSTTDLEYWKAPSRRLYVAKRDEYDEL